MGAVANQWLDVLDEQGHSMDDQELLELISERKTISKTVEDYEGRKSTSLTTAARLADFLGAEMTKDKGLNCNLIISRLPAGAPGSFCAYLIMQLKSCKRYNDFSNGESTASSYI